MASFDPIDHFPYDPQHPPPRPTTPPVRRGFLVILAGLSLAAGLVYGIPYMAERTGYAWEAGRSQAASEALRKLDKDNIIGQSSILFRMASTKVAPAVVNIQNLRYVDVPRFGRQLGRAGAGSGVVIDKAGGYIVTNHHVVKDADKLTIRLGHGGEWPATLVGADPKTDLAVLQTAAPLPVQAEWGDASKLDVGDWVLAIGSPYMLDQTVTAGIVSATARNNLPGFGEGSYQDFIQTDAAVNPGNSGGPLIDLRGTVIGVNTAIYAPPGENPELRGNVGIGFAISSTLARRIVDQLIKERRVTRGYLGVSLDNLDPNRAARLRLPEPGGVLVRDVDPDSPAAQAGLRRDDVITRVGDQKIDSVATLRNRTATLPVGSKVTVQVYRDGKSLDLAATIAELPILRTLGLRLKNVRAGGDRAVLIDLVEPFSPAQRSGFVSEMRIVAVGEERVSTKAEADAAAQKLDAEKGFLIRVETPDGRVVPVPLGYGRPQQQQRP